MQVERMSGRQQHHVREPGDLPRLTLTPVERRIMQSTVRYSLLALIGILLIAIDAAIPTPVPFTGVAPLCHTTTSSVRSRRNKVVSGETLNSPAFGALGSTSEVSLATFIPSRRVFILRKHE